MNKLHLLPAIVLVSQSVALVQAAELDPVIVTATRTAQTASASLAAVTVITRDEIERRQAHSVYDLLRGVPGLTVTSAGGFGKEVSVFMRGTNSDHVLVLIDGVKAGSATSGKMAFQDIPVEQIERIEIVRGPRSSLYGSEAIGGVIQIFTRKGAPATQPSFSVGAGSYGSSRAEAGVRGGGEQRWYNLHMTASDSEGFDSCRAEAAIDFGGCFVDEPDQDGYRNASASLRAGQRFDNGAEFELHALRTEARAEFDGWMQNETEIVQQVLGAKLRLAPATMWHVDLSAGRSWDLSDNFKDGIFASRFDTRRDHLSWQNDVTLDSGHLLTLGVDHIQDHIVSTENYTVTSRDNTGVFAQSQSSFGSHDLQLSLRRDDNEQFGYHTTGSAAWGYSLNPELRLRLAYGTAFKAPSFNDLFYPGYGNPDLKPEESQTLEVGLNGRLTRGHWEVSLYETRVDDLIVYDAMITGPNNINQARIRGLELVMARQMAGWYLNANLNLLDPQNRATGANYGKLLPRRAEQSLNLDVEREFGSTLLGASLYAANRRYDDAANNLRLAGYATLDLRAEYRLDADWWLQGRVENALDKQYETAAYYNQPDRSYWLTLRYQPK